MEQIKEKIPFEEMNQQIDYVNIASTEEFKQLLSNKKKFILPFTLFYMAYSLLLPFLALYTDVLNVPVVGDITLAWIYGVSFIPVSLWVCSVYVKKAADFDKKAKEILEKEGL
jgi:uncharacterized membrane protein (DUF485 family)